MLLFVAHQGQHTRPIEVKQIIKVLYIHKNDTQCFDRLNSFNCQYKRSFTWYVQTVPGLILL